MWVITIQQTFIAQKVVYIQHVLQSDYLLQNVCNYSKHLNSVYPKLRFIRNDKVCILIFDLNLQQDLQYHLKTKLLQPLYCVTIHTSFRPPFCFGTCKNISNARFVWSFSWPSKWVVSWFEVLDLPLSTSTYLVMKGEIPNYFKSKGVYNWNSIHCCVGPINFGRTMFYSKKQTYNITNPFIGYFA